MHNPPGHDSEALESLAGELGRRGYDTRLITPHGRPPSLTVRNPRARALAETVLAQSGWYWYSWAERIAPVDDVTGAAAIVARVLRAEGEPADA